MIITYHGMACIRVQFGDTVLAFNPIGKKSDAKSASFGADIALLSTRHKDMNGVDAVSRGDKVPFVIDGPGEYEIRGVTIRGRSTPSSYGGEGRINTIYRVTLEDMNLCVLGAHEGMALPQEAEDILENIDILFIPISGAGTLDAKEAHALSVKLEPRLIIPILYDTKSLTQFLKEEGAANGKPIDKLTIKKKDIAAKEGDVVVLSQA